MCLHHGIHNERSERGNIEEITFNYSHKAHEAESLMPVLKNPNTPGHGGRPLRQERVPGMPNFYPPCNGWYSTAIPACPPHQPITSSTWVNSHTQGWRLPLSQTPEKPSRTRKSILTPDQTRTSGGLPFLASGVPESESIPLRSWGQVSLLQRPGETSPRRGGVPRNISWQRGQETPHV